MCFCNTTVCFNFRVIKFQICGNYMILEPLPNFKTNFSQNEGDGTYDNIALNQRYIRSLQFNNCKHVHDEFRAFLNRDFQFPTA